MLQLLIGDPRQAALALGTITNRKWVPQIDWVRIELCETHYRQISYPRLQALISSSWMNIREVFPGDLTEIGVQRDLEVKARDWVTAVEVSQRAVELDRVEVGKQLGKFPLAKLI